VLEFAPPPLLVLNAGRQIAIVRKKESVVTARKKALPVMAQHSFPAPLFSLGSAPLLPPQ
jgi:hypothetical protein